MQFGCADQKKTSINLVIGHKIPREPCNTTGVGSWLKTSSAKKLGGSSHLESRGFNNHGDRVFSMLSPKDMGQRGTRTHPSKWPIFKAFYMWMIRSPLTSTGMILHVTSNRFNIYLLLGEMENHRLKSAGRGPGLQDCFKTKQRQVRRSDNHWDQLG